MPAERAKLTTPPSDEGGAYFKADPECEFFSSGCTVEDMVLGGGWVENRIINIVGDKSTGKTLQAIEAIANFAIKYPDADIYYGETESAFDRGYAASIGMPVERVKFPEGLFTVEDFFNHLETVIKAGKRALYVLDSLDALSDKAELEAEVDAASYGMAKPKQLSKLFRKLNQKLASTKITVMVISQVRDAIGVTFGKSQTRSGGKALDFYASQVIWLTHIKRLTKTRGGVTRPYGIRIRAMAEKNKVGLPFRDCEFPIYFSYGIEDVVASVEWLVEVKRHKDDGLFTSEDAAIAFLKSLDKLSNDEYNEWRKRIKKVVKAAWRDVETAFMPTRKKY